MLARLRKGILLYVLLLVAGGHWLTVNRTTSWERTLWVAVHPVNGDGSAASAEYIASLDAADFAVLDEFMAREAARHGRAIKRPLHVALGDAVREQPPAPPASPGVLSSMLWSLRLRWWAWRVDRGEDPPPSDIEIFVRYFDPQRRQRVAHSTGLQKGLLGVVNAFAGADHAGGNAVVIAHEVLHTLGASDKYDPATGLPRHPDGYAEPDAEPRHPQALAEVMGGRIPVAHDEAVIPRSLDDVVVGAATAREIRWR